MESFAKLRRRHLVQGESISAIARDLNVSRNTVKKYLRSGEVPAYRRDSQPSPKLGAFEGQLKDWLQQDGQRPKAQRRSAKRLFEDLQRVGYGGAYDSVQRYVKGWKNGQPNVASDAFIPLYFPAGEIVQVHGVLQLDARGGIHGGPHSVVGVEIAGLFLVLAHALDRVFLGGIAPLARHVPHVGE